MARLVAWLCALGWLLLASGAGADSPSLRTQVSTKIAAVGDSFTLQLVAVVDQGNPVPSGPRLSVPPGITAQGPSVGTQQQISISGGQFSQRIGISASWVLEASRPGRYRIGPPSVDVGGRRMNGDVVEIEIVPAGAAPKKPRDPFDFFGIPGFPSPPGLPSLGDDEGESTERLPPFPEEMRLQAAEDPVAFLRAVVTPARAVVGEQVTLRIYAYGNRGPFRETNTSEPSREAFLAHTLLESSYGEPMYRVPVAGNVWHAKKVRELALFPIRSGSLLIGPMRMGFDGRGYPAEGKHRGLLRSSAPLELAVSEPPLAGRPPGYKLGDVGRFTLSATVEPREIAAGEAVSVVAKLEGTGNLPFVLRTPQQKQVSWLEPTLVDQIEPRGSTMGGWRKLTYVVRVDQAGELDLGELSLPYWDPERESYDVAKARLGRIRVKPAAPGARPPETDRNDALQDAAVPRGRLGAAAPRRGTLADRSWFWLLAVLGPLGVLVTGGSVRLGRSLRERLAARRESADAQIARSLADARRAERSGDAAGAAAAVERALFSAIEGAVGLRARAVLRAELGAELVARGVEEQLAARIAEALEEAEQLRFVAAGEQSASSLCERAVQIARALSRPGARERAEG